MHTDDDPRVVILGGGLTGISAAVHLRRPWLLVEQEDRLGGHARTDRVGDFFFDRTGHWLHLRDPYTRQLVDELLPAETLRVARVARILSHGGLTRFPFQANLHGLPPTVVKECLLEFIHAWTARESAPPARDFEEFILQKMGAGIARHFMVPYNHKLWGVHPREITSQWCSRFVPIPSLDEVVAGAVGAVPPEMGYNVEFLYPRTGGIETLTRALVGRMQGGEVALRSAPEAVDWRGRRVLLGGEWVPYSALVSTIPLPLMVGLLVDPPAEVAEAGQRLRCTSLRYLNLGTRVRPKADYHWVYVPEERFPFYRVGIYSNAVPSMAPPGCGSFYVELSERGEVRKDELMPRVVEALVACGAIGSAEDVAVADLEEIRWSYVVFDHHYYASVACILPWLEAQGIYPRGRYGAWTYNSMEDALLAGREVAGKLNPP